MMIIRQATTDDYVSLIEIWEASVRATGYIVGWQNIILQWKSWEGSYV